MSEQYSEQHPESPRPASAGADRDISDDSSSTTSTTPPRRRWRAWLVGAVIVAVAVAAGGYAVTSRTAKGDEPSDDSATSAGNSGDETGGEAKDEKPPIPVEVAAVETGDVASYISATTNLVAEGEVMVLAETEGRVTRIAADEGQYVDKGQILATLAREDAEITVEKARVREANAKTVFDRGQELSKDALISAEDLDKRRLDFELAHQERAEAEWQLAKTEIRASISGRVSLRSVQPGQHVHPGDEMFQITDFDPLIARIYVPEKDVLQLDRNRAVEMSLDAAPDVRFRGRIRQISPVVDTATGTVKVTLEAQNPPSQVRPGSFVTVRVVRERRGGVVVLPREAVLRELKQTHVFVASGDGDALIAERRAVTLGLEEDGRVEAISGIEPGERLVVAGQGSLADGARVRILDAEQQG